ncbi:hypothetical protein AB0F93_03440 [Micromonospora tulbaghiae]|uniref:hypothetical protein n=1 Tax=Micromonospora tulbaghiae TaxID=479978 RepID=UPI0033D06003
MPGHVDRVPEYDPRSGDHLWTVTCAYRVDPERFTGERAGDGPALLDLENLLLTAGPGCFFCEQTWSPRLARRRCPGHPPRGR